MRWIVPYTVTWHGQHVVEADTAQEAVAEALLITELSAEGDEGISYNAHEAFPEIS